MLQQQTQSETHINIEQQSQLHCKICYLKTTPLLRLCACNGTIGFVHEECMLRWITMRLERMTILQMPVCELCKTPFSAQLKCKKDRLSMDEVARRTKEMTTIELIILVTTILGAVLLPYVEFVGAIMIINGKVENYVSWTFGYLIFPYYFGRWVYSYFGKLRQKWKECYVRQVEICLLPRQIYR